MDNKLLKQAHELREYFIDTYVEGVITSAIQSGNEDLLKITVEEYEEQKDIIDGNKESKYAPL